MGWRNGADRYGIIAQSLHWLIAVLVFIQIGLGIYVDDLPVSLARLQWIARHKSLGLLILTLFLLRLVWRGLDHAPGLPGSMPRRDRQAAKATHWLIYVLAIAAPLAGWLHASAAGLGASFFGLFPIPALISKDVGLSDLFATIHAWLVWILAAVVAVHVAAAIRHLILRDRVFERMLPWPSVTKEP